MISTETSLGAYTGVGVSFIVEIGLFAGAGWWVDGFVGSRPWLLVVGIFVGLVAATYHLLKQVDEIEARQERANLAVDEVASGSDSKGSGAPGRKP